MLASIKDLSSVIKRGTFYSVRVELIKDTVKVFFGERYLEEKFYFSYNLKNIKNQIYLWKN